MQAPDNVLRDDRDFSLVSPVNAPDSRDAIELSHRFQLAISLWDLAHVLSFQSCQRREAREHAARDGREGVAFHVLGWADIGLWVVRWQCYQLAETGERACFDGADGVVIEISGGTDVAWHILHGGH